MKKGLLSVMYNFFKNNEGKFISKDELCTCVWGEPFNPTRDDRKFHTNLHRLRKELHEGEGIKNYYNGYKYEKSTSLIIEDLKIYSKKVNNAEAAVFIEKAISCLEGTVVK